MKKFLLTLLLAFSLSCALAGEESPAFSLIPARIPKVQAGDWAEFRFGGNAFRHRVERIEMKGDEKIVHLAIETLDNAGKATKTEPMSIGANQELAINDRYAAAFGQRGAIDYGETVLVSDKPVKAIIFILPDTQDELWFSDEVGVLNLIRFDPGDGDEAKRRVTVDFGTAADAPPADGAN